MVRTEQTLAAERRFRPSREAADSKTFSQVRFRFDTLGRMTSILDRNSNDISLSYGTDGKLSTITDTANRVITLEYWTGSGFLKKVSLPAPDGRSVTYEYTGDLLTSVTDVPGDSSLPTRTTLAVLTRSSTRICTL